MIGEDDVRGELTHRRDHALSCVDSAERAGHVGAAHLALHQGGVVGIVLDDEDPDCGGHRAMASGAWVSRSRPAGSTTCRCADSTTSGRYGLPPARITDVRRERQSTTWGSGWAGDRAFLRHGGAPLRQSLSPRLPSRHPCAMIFVTRVPSPIAGGIMAAPVAPRDSDLEGRSEIFKVAAASLIGTSIEWYDFFLYGTAAALVFNKLFFPTFAPLAGTMAAFATYAVGFAARPIGGIVFGHYGDKLGRKAMLYLTLLIMGLATTAIGLLPTYAKIGIWAPIALVALRLFQGLGIGGEWGGAVLLTVEHAPAHARGFYGSWPQMGVAIGLLLSTLAFRHFSAAPEATFLAWGWRVPFLLSFILLVVGLWIRHRVAESPVFERLKRRKA